MSKFRHFGKWQVAGWARGLPGLFQFLPERLLNLPICKAALYGSFSYIFTKIIYKTYMKLNF